MKFYTNVNYTGGHILYRGYENGERVQKREKYEPTLYTTSQKKTPYKTIHGEYVQPKNFDSIWDAKKFIKEFEDVDNFNVYGNEKWQYAYLYEERLGKDWDINQIRVVNFDIEVYSDSGFPFPEKAEHPVTAICLELNGKYIVLAYKEDFDKEAAFKETSDTDLDPKDVRYMKCKDEAHMLQIFLEVWAKLDPDVITGWNIQGFDVIYMYNRLLNLFGESTANKLSPFGIVREKSYWFGTRRIASYEFVGIGSLDYYLLVHKYDRPYEQMKLDHVAEQVLGAKKIEYEGSLKQLYEQDFQKYIRYNIRDTELVKGIDEKKKFISMVLSIAYDSGVNYDEPMFQTKLWDTLIYNYLMNRNIVLPMTKVAIKDEKYKGAHVKEPTPGMFDWVVSFDLTSMYPSLIRMFNIGPDRIVDGQRADVRISDFLENTQKYKDAFKIAKANDWSLAANGCYYKHERSFLSEMMENLMVERKAAKKEMFRVEEEIQALKKAGSPDPVQLKTLEEEKSRYNNLQLAKKVCLNSAYGAMGSGYFRLYDIRNATAITISGQLAILWVQRGINEFLNKQVGTKDKDFVIAADTDSVYLNLGPWVDKVAPNIDNKTELLNRFCEKVLSKKIDEIFDGYMQATNAYEQRMDMKREAIAKKGIWQGKKRYALDLIDNEGVRFAEPKVKISGFEAVKTSTCALCREYLKGAVDIILRNDETDLHAYVKKCEADFMSQPIEKIAKPTGVSDIDKFKPEDGTFANGTPIHVKASLTYNRLLKQKGVEGKYDEILSGDKVLWVYLREPNLALNNAIAFTDTLPSEFGLEEYVDYKKQFDKTFRKPLQDFMHGIGWNTRYIPTLDHLFED